MVTMTPPPSTTHPIRGFEVKTPAASSKPTHWTPKPLHSPAVLPPLTLYPLSSLHPFSTTHRISVCERGRGMTFRSQTARFKFSVAPGKDLSSSCLSFPTCTMGPLIPIPLVGVRIRRVPAQVLSLGSRVMGKRVGSEVGSLPQAPFLASHRAKAG